MKKVLIITTLVLMGLLAGYHYEPRQLQQLLGKQTTPGDELLITDTLNLYIDELQSRHFDTQGQLARQLNTDRAAQYLGQQHILLQQPTLSAGFGNNRWLGQANTGQTHTVTEVLTLQGDVSFHQAANTAKIETGQLVIDNRNKRAFTEQAVTITTDDSLTTADGITIDFDSQTIELNSNVRTYYRPTHHPQRDSGQR